MKFFVPTPARVRAATKELRGWWQDIKERRADPDSEWDEAIFYDRWSLGGTLLPVEVADGEQKHQVATFERLKIDLARSSRALDAVGAEAVSYQNTASILLVASGFVAATKIVHTLQLQISIAMLVWAFGTLLIVLMRSHSSPVSSWWNNYEGAGEYASNCNSQYKLALSLREDVARYNSSIQRTKRRLALVCLLFTAIILAACVVVTVVVMAQAIG